MPLPKSKNVKNFYACTYYSGNKVVIAFDGDIDEFEKEYRGIFCSVERYEFYNGQIIMEI